MNIHRKTIASFSGLAAFFVTSALLPAQAEPPKLSVGGYFTQSINLLDADHRPGDSTADVEDEVLAQNAEIHFKGSTKLRSGTEIGFRVELEAESAGDQIDEHYLYLKGDFGKLIMGAENGVGHLMQVRAPSFVPGLKFFDNSITDDAIEKAYDLSLNASDAIEDAHMSTKLEHISGDANKLSYMTPRVGGLQLGLSFTPNNEDKNGGENNAVDVSEAKQTDIVEMALQYTGRRGGVSYKLGYSTVEGETEGAGLDPESSSVGLQVKVGKYQFGGNQSKYENLGTVDGKYTDSESIETTSYGLKYKLNNRTHLGIGFTDGEETHRPFSSTYVSDLGDDDEIGGSSDDADEMRTITSIPAKTNYEEITIGGGTKLGDGVFLGLYYTMSEAKHQTVSGGAITAPVAVGDDEDPDTVGSVTPFEVADTDAEVSMLGMTLTLKF